MIVRPIKEHETSFLKEMNYQALYVPDGAEQFSFTIMDSPELRKYYDNWGRKGDTALVLENEITNELVGAVWARLFSAENPGYGFVSEDIPEIGIAILPGFRNKGYGSSLLKQLISLLADKGYTGLSLSVDVQNPAIKLYKKLGFTIVKSEGNPTMLLEIAK